MSCYLYIIRSEVKETYYTGVSENIDQRLISHNTSPGGYTRKYRPWKIVYQHAFPTCDQARLAEKVIKSWKSKRMIRLLINGAIQIEDYL
jgi:putative endonuclease